jgi:hypothetical protein
VWQIEEQKSKEVSCHCSNANDHGDQGLEKNDQKKKGLAGVNINY